MRHPLTSLVTALALLVYMWNLLAAGQARNKYGVVAPAVTGHPAFERRFRVQQNMVEQLVLFLPALWVFATTVSEFWAAAIGAVFVVGRVVYTLGYYTDASKRGPGFIIGLLAEAVLLVGALYGSARIVFFGI